MHLVERVVLSTSAALSGNYRVSALQWQGTPHPVKSWQLYARDRNNAEHLITIHEVDEARLYNQQRS